MRFNNLILLLIKKFFINQKITCLYTLHTGESVQIQYSELLKNRKKSTQCFRE